MCGDGSKLLRHLRREKATLSNPVMPTSDLRARQFPSDTASASRPEAPAPSSTVAVDRSTDSITRAPSGAAPVPITSPPPPRGPPSSATRPGTRATRTPRATRRASSPASPTAITSTWSPGRNSRTVAASAIRTGAETSRADGRPDPVAVPDTAVPDTAALSEAAVPDPAVPDAAPPRPVVASAAPARAIPAAIARRCLRSIRRSRYAPPPRTRSGANGPTPRGAGGGAGGRA
ncbi:protein of unknown function [Streptomyces sp. KY70]|nr:protein of unknown function [Streptomyces sp. KY70]